jgi:hypothetical protein
MNKLQLAKLTKDGVSRKHCEHLLTHVHVVLLLCRDKQSMDKFQLSKITM